MVKTIVMRMHRDEIGQCWADSQDVAGYTAAGEDFYAVMQLVRESVGLGFIPWGSDEEPDVRWQWCSIEIQPIKAVRVGGEPAVITDAPCPCVSGEKVLAE